MDNKAQLSRIKYIIEFQILSLMIIRVGDQTANRPPDSQFASTASARDLVASVFSNSLLKNLGANVAMHDRKLAVGKFDFVRSVLDVFDF